MYTTRSEYDRGVNTFSPEGRLFQVEYALGAVKLGSTSIGIKTSEGVVLVTERRIQSKLMETTHDVEKLRRIDDHIGCASSGIIADSLILIDHARVEAQHHFFTYNERFPVESCVTSISELALEFSAVDVDGPSLWCADPSGTTTKYEAAAIGSAQEGAETLLQEKYHSNMTLKEAEEVALVVLRQVMEEKLTASNIEVAAVPTATKRFHVYTLDEVKAIVDRLPEQTVPTAATTFSTTMCEVTSLREVFQLVDALLDSGGGEVVYTRLAEDLQLSPHVAQRLLACYLQSRRDSRPSLRCTLTVGCCMTPNGMCSPSVCYKTLSGTMEELQAQLMSLRSHANVQRIDSITLSSVFQCRQPDGVLRWRNEAQHALAQYERHNAVPHDDNDGGNGVTPWVPFYMYCSLDVSRTAPKRKMSPPAVTTPSAAAAAAATFSGIRGQAREPQNRSDSLKAATSDLPHVDEEPVVVTTSPPQLGPKRLTTTQGSKALKKSAGGGFSGTKRHVATPSVAATGLKEQHSRSDSILSTLHNQPDVVAAPDNAASSIPHGTTTADGDTTTSIRQHHRSNKRQSACVPHTTTASGPETANGLRHNTTMASVAAETLPLPTTSPDQRGDDFTPPRRRRKRCRLDDEDDGDLQPPGDTSVKDTTTTLFPNEEDDENSKPSGPNRTACVGNAVLQSSRSHAAHDTENEPPQKKNLRGRRRERVSLEVSSECTVDDDSTVVVTRVKTTTDQVAKKGKYWVVASVEEFKEVTTTAPPPPPTGKASSPIVKNARHNNHGEKKQQSSLLSFFGKTRHV